MFHTHNNTHFLLCSETQMQAMQETRPDELQKENELQLDEHNQFHQHVIVMRHGDRVDSSEPMWIITARRPWDPPLTESGRIRAFCTGRKLRGLDFPIHRVFVSPFLRCIQTAFEVSSALCAVQDDNIEMTSENVPIDPSKIKVSVEYGLCEVISKEAISSNLTPKDGNWGFDISKLEEMLPAGTVDQSVEHLYQDLPKWEESLMDARARYKQVIHALADKYPCENLLFVTHGEGVGIAVSTFMEDTTVYEVEYCGYAHTRRQVTFKAKTFTASDFEVCSMGIESGITYCPTSVLPLDV